MVYLISYDLNKTDKDYKGMYAAIKSYGTWCHPLDSTWLIETTSTAEDVYNVLNPHIDNNDNLLIINVTKNYYGRLPKNTWEWLKVRNF